MDDLGRVRRRLSPVRSIRCTLCTSRSEDGVGVCRVADYLVPFVDRDLAGQDRRAAAVAFFENLEEIAAGAGIERFEAPIVEDEELGAGKGSQDAGMAAVAAGQRKIGEQLGDALVKDRAVVAAGLVPESTSNPTFADAGRAAQRCYGASGEDPAPSSLEPNRRRCPMPQPNDLSRSLTGLDQDSTLIAVVEMSQSSWLVGAIIPGVERRPAKKLEASEGMLLALLHRWRDEAAKAGCTIDRITVAFEAGRDGFWLARWLQARGIEVHVIHATSIAVSREHRRAKTDRLDAALLQRAFLGWLRGERGHCTMVAVASLAEEDAKRPSREREALVGERTRIGNRMKSTLARLGIRGIRPGLRKAAERLEQLRTPEGAPLPPNTLSELRRDLARLRLINDQIAEIEAARLERLRQQPDQARHPMILLLARVIGIGIETADMLVQEVLSRKLRDRRAVARYGGLTGSPEESGARRREKGLARAGNARVRRGMLQLAWRFLMFQKDSALAQWYRARTADARGATRKTMIVALARKLLVALWKLVTTGELPNGVVLRPPIQAAV